MSVNTENASYIEQTKLWLEKIIVGLNFCPFAKKELVNNTIHYQVSSQGQVKTALHELIEQCRFLQQHDNIETTLIIYPDTFRSFERYLDLIDYANDLIVAEGFEGIFQLASFHPEYCFAGEDFDDASNYTNRSPYPTIHIIREESMARVLAVYREPEKIPDNNIALAQKKGTAYFESVLANIKNHYR